MKKIFSISFIMIICISLFLSCKKDTDPQTATVELKEANDTLFTGIVNTFPAQEDVPTFTLQLAGGEKAQEAITVKLVKNMAVVTAYNTLHFTNYTELPASLYQLPDGLNVVIPQGQSSAKFKLKLLKPGWDYTQNFAIGYSVESVSGSNSVSSTLKNIILAISLRNKYDGLWTMNGTVTDITNGAIGPWPNAPVALVTTGAGKVTMYNMVTTVPAWFNQPFHPTSSAGAYTVYGGWAPEFTFDAADNIVAASNYYGNPNPVNTRGTIIDPTGTNNYTVVPGVTTIRAKYIMTQPSVVPASPHHRTFFNMTLTYTGPR